MLSVIRTIETALQSIYPPDECRALACWVVEEATGLTRTQIISGCKDTKNIPNIEIILQRLQKKEPIQYIFGHTLWSGLDLRLTQATLIPRPETAELVEIVSRNHALNLQHLPLNVLDIGTGSGCIAIALKRQHPEWNIYAVDISQDALDIARENAISNDAIVHFSRCDILNEHPFPDCRFDIVVSNPPYITEQEKQLMDTNVLDYEPHAALFVPDTDPLLFYRSIAGLRLAPYLYFEINEAYGAALESMLRQYGYQDITLQNDAYGKPRILAATTDIPC